MVYLRMKRMKKGNEKRTLKRKTFLKIKGKIVH